MQTQVHVETPEALATERSGTDQCGIAGIAHDLSNVVTAILICSGLLLRQVSCDSPLRAQLEQVNAAAEQGRGLVAALSRLTRGEGKRTSFGSTKVR